MGLTERTIYRLWLSTFSVNQTESSWHFAFANIPLFLVVMADLTITPLPDTEIDPYERIYCNGAFFGEPITVRQVYEAANTLSDFQGPVDYQSINPNAPNYIPQEYYSGGARSCPAESKTYIFQMIAEWS